PAPVPQRSIYEELPSAGAWHFGHEAVRLEPQLAAKVRPDARKDQAHLRERVRTTFERYVTSEERLQVRQWLKEQGLTHVRDALSETRVRRALTSMGNSVAASVYDLFGVGGGK